MKEKIWISLVILSALMMGYLLISWVGLGGHLTYYTSHTESTIAESKLHKSFVIDQLNLKYEGDSLERWEACYNIWISKRQMVKYFGLWIHWTFENPSWRYLHVEQKCTGIDGGWSCREFIINHDTLDYKAPCSYWMECQANDTITLQFNHWGQPSNMIGNLTVLIK